MSADNSPFTSIPALLRDLRDESTTLLRQEVALAKAELQENAAHAAKHAGHIATGGALAYAGVIVLLWGLGQLLALIFVRIGLSAGVALWLGPVGLGLLVALIGWLLLVKAKTAFSAAPFAPRQTLQTLEEIKQTLPHSIHPSL